MSSAVTELETGLQAMLGLKPPGVSGSRITSITALCVNNVQSESVLIQKIYTHFKKAPPTHKLGVLYVVDSVTRKWLDQAKSLGQAINSSAQDGTFAAGVLKVTELMPVLMNDIIHSAPNDQKEKIRKLIDIWEKGQTFPIKMIESFKEKLNAVPKSTTPEGSPPPSVLGGVNGKAPAAPVVPNSTSIMEALANIARQNASAPAPQSNPSLAAPTGSYNLAPTLSSLLPSVSATLPQAQPPYSYAAPTQPVTAPTLPFQLPPQYPHPTQPTQAAMLPPAASNPLAAFGGVLPQAGTPALDPTTQNQLLLIKALSEQGVPFDKIPALIQTMTAAMGNTGYPSAMPTATASYSSHVPAQAWNTAAAPPPGINAGPESRDRSGAFNDGIRSPRGRGRSRSRSPGRHWDSHSSPRGRDQFDYDHNSPGRGRHDGADRDRSGRGQDSYRQRSPSPHRDRGRDASDKWVEFDRTLPSGHIKVLSRTLFVGGVTVVESELRNIFSRFGTVQTCIVNREKRHAFVKMLSRDDAVRAKEALDEKHNEFHLRCRWGVGFGPRDCSDYSTGISVIPISKLTEADRKWMLTAEYGGSGGRKIETGMVVEEPDIEIGAGVSSKAISRRMATDKGGSNGPKSTRGGNGSDSRGGRGSGSGGDDDLDGSNSNSNSSSLTRWRRNRPNRDEDTRNPNHMPVAQPAFPFGLQAMANGMPNFPPGFMFPAPDANAK